MGEKTNISWTHHTFNIAWGCTKVSEGCRFCYADRDATRYGFKIWGPNAERRTFGPKHWKEPLQWNAMAKQAHERRLVFCSSMCDVFEDHPTITKERQKLWDLIKTTPYLTWQLLTKRAERIADCLPEDWGKGYDNVWLGVSAENQDWYHVRVQHLQNVLAAKKFVSAEPLLGPIFALKGWLIDWLIIGGESGPHSRQADVTWITDLAKEASDARIAVFVKQDSGLHPGKQGRIPDPIWSLKQFP